MGLCQEVSVWEVSVRETPHTVTCGGTHPTGMYYGWIFCRFVLHSYVELFTCLILMEKGHSTFLHAQKIVISLIGWIQQNAFTKQECIPVGCLPSTAVAVSQGVYLVLGGTWSWGVYLVLGGVTGPGGVPGREGVYLVLGGVPGSGGCAWLWGVYLVSEGVPGAGEVYLVLGGGGCNCPGESLSRGSMSRGISVQGGL